MFMRSTLHIAAALIAVLTSGAPAAAQQAADIPNSTPVAKATPVDDSSTPDAAAAESSWKKGRPITMQYYRALDQRGINVFETTKAPGVEFTGFKLDFGAAFTSQVQSLSHGNTAAPNVVGGVNANQLADIGFGFNTPTANL